MTIRFLQTSDWHLGARLSSFEDDKAQSRRKEFVKTAGSIISSALDEDIKLAFLPGDIFDNEKPSMKLVSVFLDLIQPLLNADVQIFIVPGTHDYYIEKGLWDSPDFADLHIFRQDGFSSIDIEDSNITIWGVPVKAGNRDRNWFKDSPKILNKRTNILLFHGDYRGKGREYAEWDYPFESEDLAESAFSYIALGHHHSSHLIEMAGKTAAGYSGTPLGWSYRKSEIGERHYIIGDIRELSVEIELRQAPGPQMNIFEIDLSKPSLAEKAVGVLAELDSDSFVKIILTGAEDPMDLSPRIRELEIEFNNLIIEDERSNQFMIDPSQNYHLKSLLDKLDQHLQQGIIDKSFHKRLSFRAKQIFSK